MAIDLTAAVADETRRTTRTVLRLSPADVEALRAAAAAAGLPPATWARAAVRAALQAEAAPAAA